MCKDSTLSVEVVTAIAAVIAIFITAIRNSWEKQAAQRKLFAEFNKRFDRLNEDLNAIYEGKHPITVGRKPQDIIQDYLNLCAEECLWYRKNLIDDDIWTAWQEGMLYYLKKPIFAEHFTTEKAHSAASYYGLFEELRWPKPQTV